MNVILKDLINEINNEIVQLESTHFSLSIEDAYDYLAIKLKDILFSTEILFNIFNEYGIKPMTNAMHEHSLYEKMNEQITGKEEIEGDYFIYECIGHSGEKMIMKCLNLKEVEDYIKSEYFNRWVTNSIIIEKGKVKRFNLYSNVNGEKCLVIDSSKGFKCYQRKDNKLIGIIENNGDKYKDVIIEWV